MKIFSFLKLVRWPNLLLTALMMFLVNDRFVKPALIIRGTDALSSNFSFVLLVIAMVFIVAGGYVVNDMFDVAIDKVNKPKKVIIGKELTINECKVFYIIINVLGLAAGIVASILALGDKALFLPLTLFLFISVLYSYSKTYKRQLIVGNLIVAVLVAAAVVLPWLFGFLHLTQDSFLLRNNVKPMFDCFRYVGFYAVFAFLITLCREIVKDMEDVEGDRLGNCSSIPLEWGMKTAKIIFSVIGVILVAAIYVFYGHIQDTKHSFFDVFINMTAVVIIFSLKDVITFSENKRNLHSASVNLKIAMFIGILSMLFI